MNHARKIASMLGLEIGEKFKIKGHPDYGTFWFVDDQSEGLKDLWQVELEKGFYDAEIEINDLLEQILTGFYEVEKMPRKPKKGEHYWDFTIYSSTAHAEEHVWIGHSVDFANWKVGNCFKTKEEAETKGREIIEQIKKEYEEA